MSRNCELVPTPEVTDRRGAGIGGVAGGPLRRDTDAAERGKAHHQAHLTPELTVRLRTNALVSRMPTLDVLLARLNALAAEAEPSSRRPQTTRASR